MKMQIYYKLKKYFLKEEITDGSDQDDSEVEQQLHKHSLREHTKEELIFFINVCFSEPTCPPW